MKPRKAIKSEPSLLDQLNKPLRDFVSDFVMNGPDALEKLRQENPSRNVAAKPCRIAGIDLADERGQSALGCTTHSWRAGSSSALRWLNRPSANTRPREAIRRVRAGARSCTIMRRIS